jgi:hypothetical protein
MLPNPQTVEVALAVEHEGHTLLLQGKSPRLTATLPSFSSLIHFLRVLWPLRERIPVGLEVEVRWWKISVPFRKTG